MKKILFFVSLYFLSFCPSAFSLDEANTQGGGQGLYVTPTDEQWMHDRNKFVGKYDSLPDKAEKVTYSCDGGTSWIENIKDLQTQNQYNASLDNCQRSINSSYESEIQEAIKLKYDLGITSNSGHSWKEIFPEHQQNIQALSNEMRQYLSVVPPGSALEGVATASVDDKGLDLLRSSVDIGFVKEKSQDPFIIERKNILDHYGCGKRDPISLCYDLVIKNNPEEVNCLKKVGFKKCRPFLKGGCQANDVLALSSEIFQEDKDGMAYI
ncbi:MAG: hypothetical protein OXB86_03075, partial [Bdellovibrionales bacterium]|nr:hypothetical protein [Bdellovibrionales bacterium]